MRLARASSSPSVKMYVCREKYGLEQAALCPGHRGVQGWAPCGFTGILKSHPCPTFEPQFPHMQSGAQVPTLSGSGLGAQEDPTPYHPTPYLDSWAQGQPAAAPARARCGAPPTRQVTGSGCPAHLARHTPLLTQCPACGRGGGWGGQAEEVRFGKPSLNQSGTKASAGRPPSTGGQRARREDESPGVVRQLCPGPRCEGNSAALSGSGRTAHYHTAGLVNWARLGTRSGGLGCGHSPAVLRAGPSTPGPPSHPWLRDQPVQPVTFSEPKQPPGF